MQEHLNPFNVFIFLIVLVALGILFVIFVIIKDNKNVGGFSVVPIEPEQIQQENLYTNDTDTVTPIIQDNPPPPTPTPPFPEPQKKKGKGGLFGSLKNKIPFGKKKDMIEAIDIPEATQFPSLKDHLESEEKKRAALQERVRLSQNEANLDNSNNPIDLNKENLSQQEKQNIDQEIETSFQLDELKDNHEKTNKLLKEKNDELQTVKNSLESELKNRKEFNKVKDILEKELSDTKTQAKKVQGDLSATTIEAETHKKRVNQLEDKVTKLEKSMLEKEDELEKLNKKLSATPPPAETKLETKKEHSEDIKEDEKPIETPPVQEEETSQAEKPIEEPKTEAPLDNKTTASEQPNETPEAPLQKNPNPPSEPEKAKAEEPKIDEKSEEKSTEETPNANPETPAEEPKQNLETEQKEPQEEPQKVDTPKPTEPANEEKPSEEPAQIPVEDKNPVNEKNDTPNNAAQNPEKNEDEASDKSSDKISENKTDEIKEKTLEAQPDTQNTQEPDNSKPEATPENPLREEKIDIKLPESADQIDVDEQTINKNDAPKSDTPTYKPNTTDTKTSLHLSEPVSVSPPKIVPNDDPSGNAIDLSDVHSEAEKVIHQKIEEEKKLQNSELTNTENPVESQQKEQTDEGAEEKKVEIKESPEENQEKPFLKLKPDIMVSKDSKDEEPKSDEPMADKPKSEEEGSKEEEPNKE